MVPSVVDDTKKNKARETEGKKRKRRSKGRKGKPYRYQLDSGQFLTFSALMGLEHWLVLRLWFMRWIHATVLVHDSRHLFQDSPSHFTHLRVAVKSSSDRLPRRTRLCVLFHAYQLLIICVGPWAKWWVTRCISWIWLNETKGWRWWCLWVWCQCERGGAWWSGGGGVCGCTVVVVEVCGRMIMSRSSS